MKRLATLLGAASVATLAACTSVTYAPTPVPSPPTTTTARAPSTSAPTCTNATQSYDPLASLPTSGSLNDNAMRRIIGRGHLVVGVSADTYLFGSRNPQTGQIEGFDIDVAREVAKSIFGDPNKIQLRVITAADRIPVLQNAPNNEVDLVARNMTMTCERWNDIAFSAEYYHAGQKLLVRKGEPEDTSLAQMAGKKVCAPNGTSSLAKLREFGQVKAVTAENHTGCLVLFQQGAVDGITGDDTVLAGLSAQDPYAVVTSAKAITDEPYGLGIPKQNIYFARYVNKVLADMKADGRWKAIYDKWLAEPLGPAPKPPVAVDGRP